VVAAALSVSVEQRFELERMAASTSLPRRRVVQAKGLLLACDGVANEEIARRCGVNSDTVRRWRSGFVEQVTARVGVIAKGRGRKPGLPEGAVEEVLRLTHQERWADGSTQWRRSRSAMTLGSRRNSSMLLACI
jgi:transposase